MRVPAEGAGIARVAFLDIILQFLIKGGWPEEEIGKYVSKFFVILARLFFNDFLTKNPKKSPTPICVSNTGWNFWPEAPFLEISNQAKKKVAVKKTKGVIKKYPATE